MTEVQGGPVPPARLRSFGIGVAVVAGIWGAWPRLTGTGAIRAAGIAVGILALATALARPGALAPLFAAWMWLGRTMGRVVTPVVLAVLFYGIVTPMGLIRRTFGGDQMGRRLDPGADTYRHVRTPRPKTHMRRLY